MSDPRCYKNVRMENKWIMYVLCIRSIGVRNRTYFKCLLSVFACMPNIFQAYNMLAICKIYVLHTVNTLFICCIYVQVVSFWWKLIMLRHLRAFCMLPVCFTPYATVWQGLMLCAKFPMLQNTVMKNLIKITHKIDWAL